MAMNIDCRAWEALTLGLRQVTGIKAFEAVDLVEAEMNLLARKIMNDPRRSAAVQQDCPRRHAEIQARVQGAQAARQIQDPSHGAAELQIWLTSLPAETLADVDKAVKAELANRKKRKAK